MLIVIGKPSIQQQTTKLSFWEVRGYMWILMGGVSTPNPCIVQGSSVLIKKYKITISVLCPDTSYKT